MLDTQEQSKTPETVPKAGKKMGASHDTSNLRNSWDFAAKGGYFGMDEGAQAREFFQRHGFVVFTNVMSPTANEEVKRALVEDLHEINPSTQDVNDVSGFKEADLPTSPNHSFRTTCNIVFGKFARKIRADEGVRKAFSELHETPAHLLGCSWDTIFYTSQASEVTNTLATQLHWDHNGYCLGEKVPLAEDLCVQGVYYASGTTTATPSFCCSPGSPDVWRHFSESDLNPSKAGGPLLNYMPCEPFGYDFVLESGLPPPVRIHVPAASLLLWNSRTCHGNCPAFTKTESGPAIGRVSLAVSFGPVAKRSAAVHKDSLVKALGGVRTTHHPTLMLSHDKQGYPVDWTAEAEYEPNKALKMLAIPLNPEVGESEFQEMIERADLAAAIKEDLHASLSLDNVQSQVYRSYWGLSEKDTYKQLQALRFADLRRLIHSDLSTVQGHHPAEDQEQ